MGNVIKLMLMACALLAGCTLTPGSNDELPEGVTDPKVELVEHLKDNPGDLDSHADLLRMQIKDGDAEGARTTVGHAIKHNGGDFRAHLLAAQFHRWQADLLSAERSLLAARDLAPQRLEPRVALSSLYNQTYLEAEEIEQRRLTLELAEDALKPEFTLDYAYALAALGRDDEAQKAAQTLIAAGKGGAARLSRAHVLLCEIALREEREDEGVSHLIEAIRLQPTYEGLIQYAARLVTAVKDGSRLATIFDETLATQDRAELRWTALFGNWMLAVKAAVDARKDPLATEVDRWYQRLDAVSPSHPDTLSRRYQLLRLDDKRQAEADEAGKQLQEIDFGLPPAPKTAASLMRLWRAEDALRLGVPGITLAELTQLEAREPKLEGTRIMRTMALFRAREDARCMADIDNWLAESDQSDEFLQAMRWWLMLRDGRALEVLAEIRARESEPTNASLWIEAVATFHVYRAG